MIAIDPADAPSYHTAITDDAKCRAAIELWKACAHTRAHVCMHAHVQMSGEDALAEVRTAVGCGSGVAVFVCDINTEMELAVTLAERLLEVRPNRNYTTAGMSRACPQLQWHGMGDWEKV